MPSGEPTPAGPADGIKNNEMILVVVTAQLLPEFESEPWFIFSVFVVSIRNTLGLLNLFWTVYPNLGV